MNIILIENSETLKKCTDLAYTKVMSAAIDCQEVYLKSQFDCAGTDATVLATIKAAHSLGLWDLAADMRDEYFIKTGRVAS